MMNMREVKSVLRDLLYTLPVCKPSSGGNNLVVRCPYCGDSHNPSHGHFSIRCGDMDDEPIVYRCFKCPESGLFTEQVLNDLGIICLDQNFLNGLKYQNLKSGGRRGFKSKGMSYVVPDIDLSESIQQMKINYVGGRLGVVLNAEVAKRFNIVTSLVKFMSDNHISMRDSDGNPRIKLGTLKELENKYVGFLSADSNTIAFRDCTGDGYFGKHYKFTIDNYLVSPNKFYIVPTKIDPLYTDTKIINISEGAFDILSIYLMKGSDERENEIFCASCGYGFTSILRYLIYGCGITSDIKLNIYSDLDKTDDDHKKALSRAPFPVWVNDVRVHRNAYPGEKDYGVPRAKIDDISYRLKQI